MHPDGHSRAITILLVALGIIFLLGIILILGRRLFVLHYRRQEAPRNASIDLTPYVRRLSPVMFGDSELGRRAGPDLPSGQDRKYEFELDVSTFDETLPTFPFKEGCGNLDSKECSVCLEDFREGEKVRILPRCGHCFHAACVDMWLYSHTMCPVCRSEVETQESQPTRTLLTGPLDSQATYENDPQNVSHPPSSSSGVGACPSFSSWRVPTSEPYPDLEQGQNGTGPQIREKAGR